MLVLLYTDVICWCEMRAQLLLRQNLLLEASNPFFKLLCELEPLDRGFTFMAISVAKLTLCFPSLHQTAHQLKVLSVNIHQTIKLLSGKYEYPVRQLGCCCGVVTDQLL